MIRWNSTVRVKENGRLGFVCDFDEGVCGDLADPSCVRTVTLFDAGVTRDEWNRIECFLEDLDEVVESEGLERHLVCADFEYMRIDNYWTEDTPPERHYTIWVVTVSGETSAWLERGYAGPLELIAHLGTSETAKMKEAIDKAGICDWRRYYNHNDWYIGSNAWGITLIRGNRKVTTEGDDAYHRGLERFCDELRGMGLPIAFWERHGLVYSPLRKKKKRKRLFENQAEG